MKKYLSEYISTFALVFCGTGAIVINTITAGQVTHLGIAIVFGLTVLAMIYTFGDISGAHMNPAVTIGFWMAGRFPGKEIIPYIFSQLIGAVSASAVLKLLYNSTQTLGVTAPSGSLWQSFILEIILTLFLMLVILNVSTGSKEKGITAGIAISSVIILASAFAGPVSGASMNPARSIGPALVMGQLSDLWIYVTAPIIGATIAVLCCKGVREKDCCPAPAIFCKLVEK